MDIITNNSMITDALVLTICLSLIPLGASLVVGIITGVAQACTQVQEATIGYVPKVCVVAAVLWLMGPWMGSQVMQFMKIALVEIGKI